MTKKENTIQVRILNELLKQFPDLKPKIAEITEHSFTYELEKHDNYTYYKAGYRISESGSLIIDWENAELTLF